MSSIFVLILLTLTTFLVGGDVKFSAGEWGDFIGKDLDGNGKIVEIIRESFDNEGINLNVKFFPWKRALKNSLEGDGFSGSLIWPKYKETDGGFLFSDEPVLKSDIVVFHLRNKDINWDGTLPTIKGLKIGVRSARHLGELVDKGIESKQLNIQEVPKDILNFKKLLKGRVDIVITDYQTGCDIIANNFTPEEQAKFVVHSIPVVKDMEYYLLVNRAVNSAEALITSFSKGFKTLVDDGRYDEIMGVVIIANKDLNSFSSTKTGLKALYLNDRVALENGKNVQISISANKGVHRRFLKEYVGKSSSSFNSYWKKLVFSGEADMPQKLASDKKVMEFVKSNSGGIGYISASSFKHSDKFVKLSVRRK